MYVQLGTNWILVIKIDFPRPDLARLWIGLRRYVVVSGEEAAALRDELEAQSPLPEHSRVRLCVLEPEQENARGKDAEQARPVAGRVGHWGRRQ